MKTLLVTLTVVAFFGMAFTSVSAETITLKAVAADKYLAFGNGFPLTKQPAIQADLFVQFDTGFYVDLWASRSLGDKVPANFGNEIDLNLGWNHTWDNKWAIDVGVSYFDEPLVGKFGSQDIIYSHVKVSHPLFAGITASAMFENYANMPGTGINGGNLYGLFLSRDFPITEKLVLSASAGPVYDDGGYGLKSGILFRGNATLEWKVTKNFSILPLSVNWYIPTMGDSRKTDAMWMAGVSWKLK